MFVCFFLFIGLDWFYRCMRQIFNENCNVFYIKVFIFVMVVCMNKKLVTLSVGNILFLYLTVITKISEAK